MAAAAPSPEVIAVEQERARSFCSTTPTGCGELKRRGRARRLPTDDRAVPRHPLGRSRPATDGTDADLISRQRKRNYRSFLTSPRRAPGRCHRRKQFGAAAGQRRSPNLRAPSSHSRSVRVYWDAGSAAARHRYDSRPSVQPGRRGEARRETLGVPPDVVMQAQIGATGVKVEQNSFSFDFTVDLASRAPVRRRNSQCACGERTGRRADGCSRTCSPTTANNRPAPSSSSRRSTPPKQGEELDKLRQQVARVQDELRQFSGRTDVLPEGVQAAMTKLEDSSSGWSSSWPG